VNSGVPQGSILGLVLVLIFLNGIDEGLNCDILKFADDSKMAPYRVLLLMLLFTSKRSNQWLHLFEIHTNASMFLNISE
jgi:hypothetical protein